MGGVRKENESLVGKSVQFLVQLYVILFIFGTILRLVRLSEASREFNLDCVVGLGADYGPVPIFSFQFTCHPEGWRYSALPPACSNA
jgi:hypothetical protein